MYTDLIGSFHMISHAKRLWSMGSGRWVGISSMADMSPSPRVGMGIPPCTQNTCMHNDGCKGVDTECVCKLFLYVCYIYKEGLALATY